MVVGLLAYLLACLFACFVIIITITIQNLTMYLFYLSLLPGAMIARHLDRSIEFFRRAEQQLEYLWHSPSAKRDYALALAASLMAWQVIHTSTAPLLPYSNNIKHHMTCVDMLLTTPFILFVILISQC